jgi:hypothetical protein
MALMALTWRGRTPEANSGAHDRLCRPIEHDHDNG